MRRLAVLAAVVVLLSAAVPASAAGSAPRWVASWAAAPQAPFTNAWTAPNWSVDGFADQSVRQVVRVSTGGRSVRIRLSNVYGSGPLRIAGATIARSTGGTALSRYTLRKLTFGRSIGVTVRPGDTVVSDPVALALPALSSMAVTVYYATPTGPVTFHETGLTTTYRAGGDHRFDVEGAAFAADTTESFYHLSGVDVAGSGGTVVAFGDSITDGYGSTPGTNRRYPDRLAERLAATGRARAVANAGIGGNKLLTDSPCYGDAGVRRFTRDAIGQPGVRTVIVLIGVNDIVAGGSPDFGCGAAPRVGEDELIAGYRALIRAAHARGLRVMGATITQFKGNEYFYTKEREGIRDAVNEWIRGSGEYDGVVDLDRLLADPDDADALNPAYASPDLVHPNDAGMAAIANAINLACL